MNADILLLGPADADRLQRVAPDVFDDPVDPARTIEFLTDPRHHLVVAVANGLVVGFVSAVHYVHPDKPPELWINEVGVAPTHHRQGLGQAMMRRMLQHGKDLGCSQAWVLTESANGAARALYGSVGGTEAAGASVLVEFPLGDP